MPRFFNFLVTHDGACRPSRFRKQVKQPSPVGTILNLSCGEVSPNLGDLELKVVESGKTNICPRDPLDKQQGDSYAILRMPDGGPIPPTVGNIRFSRFMQENGWELF